ncbi:MAG: thioredoxin domain-containing protein, partial [Ginsengibacter sp.]
MRYFTNNLKNETSPYLLQHAHNPVDWYPWGEEALQKAKKHDKPILVSIGYSACHWCHVMEKESFENEDTAKLMNEYFINIKIDREERPDLDHIYMDAVQAIAGNGGWPLNVFLTPDCKPFYGGTYFPPVKAFNRASWKEVLTGIHKLFTEKREQVEAQAEELTRHIGQTNLTAQGKNVLFIDGNELFTWSQADAIFKNIIKQADKQWGGFGNAPKFPQTFTIKYLLRYYHYTKNEEALKQACLSLDKMIYGGIYDHVGGGFARYSTDAEWLAPHFEKMLYDNALIISALCDAYQLTGNKLYKKTVEQTIDFIKRELMNDEGGFFSALDADSEGVEGKYYVWSFDEIREILGQEAGLFCEFYDVSPQGNWEHTNILRVLVPLNEFSQIKNIEATKLENILEACLSKLLLQRNKRMRPQLDDKILLSWNALMNIALCKASAIFGETTYREVAVANFDFLWSKFRINETTLLYHTFKNGIAKYPAFLDDYSYLVKACIHLQEITSEQIYLRCALSVTKTVIENFSENIHDHFYYTGKFQTDVIVRKKEIYDGAVPSGNSVMATNLLYLSLITDNKEWKERGVTLLTNLSEIVINHPTSFGNWACTLIDQVTAINEIAVVGKGFEQLRNELLKYFIPNKVFQCSQTAGGAFPLLSNKTVFSQPLIYLCRNYICQSPTNNVD